MPFNRLGLPSGSFLGIGLGRRQKNLRMQAHFVIRIDVVEKDLAFSIDNKVVP
jgi:hypothetical protein